LKNKPRQSQSRADEQGKHGAHHAEVKHSHIFLCRSAAEQDTRKIHIGKICKARPEMQDEHDGNQHDKYRAV